MTIKEFIEKAIEGGWRDLSTKGVDHFIVFHGGDGYGEPNYINIVYTCVGVEPPCNSNTVGFTKYEILLDPKAWQAVGKVEGWNGVAYWKSEYADMTPAEFYMHNMVEHLFERGTITSYIESL